MVLVGKPAHAFESFPAGSNQFAFAPRSTIHTSNTTTIYQVNAPSAINCARSWIVYYLKMPKKKNSNHIQKTMSIGELTTHICALGIYEYIYRVGPERSIRG